MYLCTFGGIETMRIEKSYLETISCLQWAYKLIGKMMWVQETIKENEENVMKAEGKMVAKGGERWGMGKTWSD